MKWDSIKFRLLFMTAVCVLGMTLLVVSQHYFNRALLGLSEQREELQELKQDLLQLRRHEKDFLLRKNPDYLTQFRVQHTQFVSALNGLDDIVKSYQLPSSLVGEIAESTQAYTEQLFKLVTLMKQVGLTPNEGLNKVLYRHAENLFVQGQRYDPQLQAELSRLQFLVVDYQHTLRAESLTELTQLSQAITRSNQLLQEDQQLVNEYINTLGQWVALRQQIGLRASQGLRGQFREQAHNVEAALQRLDDALLPVIEAQKQRATLFGSGIAIVTSVALILLLVKSFATFHRAFANFMLFFYRCKRQYQHIDSRKLGFSEFRSLAELANEMVESRRQIERRLAKAEQHASTSPPD